MTTPAAVDERLIRYVRRHLMDSAQGQAEIRLLKPERGVKSFVRIVEIDGRQPYVLRLYPSWRLGRFGYRLRVEKLLRENGLPAPRVLLCRAGIPLVRPGIIVEERLEGMHVVEGEWTAERIEALARTLAQYHQVSAASHGLAGRLAPRSFGALWMKRVANRLAEAGAFAADQFEAAGMQNELRPWFASWEARLSSLREFDLIHDKLNPGNVLLCQQEGGACAVLLDFETLQYGHRAKDLAQARYDVLFGDEQAWEMFYASYRGRIPSEAAEKAESLMPFFNAYTHLAALAVLCKRRARHGKGMVGEKAQRILERLRKEIEVSSWTIQ